MRIEMGLERDNDDCCDFGTKKVGTLRMKTNKDEQDASSSDRLSSRLHATVAGLKELDILRERHGNMVEDVLKMLETGDTDQSKEKRAVEGPGLTRKTSQRVKRERVRTRTPRTKQTDEKPHSCPECDLLNQKLSRISVLETKITDRPLNSDEESEPRRHSDPCNILITDRERRRRQDMATERYFSLPREFSGTTYNFPSPMHAVLMQYHWTASRDQHPGGSSTSATTTSPTKEEWPCGIPQSHRRSNWSSELENPSDHTKMMGLPFMFLREQIKPENNSLDSVREATNSITEAISNITDVCPDDLDEEDDTVSSMLSLSSRSTLSSRSSCASLKSLRSCKLRRFSLASSLEEGYFSRPDTPSGSIRTSGSEASFCSTGSANTHSENDICSTGSEEGRPTELDLPEAFKLLEHNLKPTRLTGFDDSWVLALDQIPHIRDSVL